MNVEQLLDKYGNRRFVAEGLNQTEAYMVVEDTILYIEANNIELAEGLPLNIIQPLIKRHFNLANFAEKVQ